MSDADDLAKLLCGDPDAELRGTIAQAYINSMVLLIAAGHCSCSGEPHAAKRRLLSLCKQAVQEKIEEEAADHQKVKDSSIGAIFGSLVPGEEETLKRSQDAINDVHAMFTSGLDKLLSSIDPPGSR